MLTARKAPKRRSPAIAPRKKKAKEEKEVKRPLGRRAASSARLGPDDLARIALDLFAERHFASVTIKDIGRAAQVNSAMIYYYYEDKADLFRAAIESAIDEAFNLFAEHCNKEKHENEAAAISAWFDVHVKLYKRLRNVIKISLDCKGIVGNVPEANEPIKRFYRHEREILQGLIQSGIEAGIFREVDPVPVATMISTMLDGVLARSIFLKDFEMVKTVEAFKQTIMLYLGYTGRKSRKLAAVADSM
jgi:AcrR family transcriptional regulator